MAKILHFSKAPALESLTIRGGSVHDVAVCIADTDEPEEARWHLQFAVQNAGSFRALKGLKDTLARSGGWHRFKIGSTRLTRRFIRQIDRLIVEGRVTVKIDGARVYPKIRRVA